MGGGGGGYARYAPSYAKSLGDSVALQRELFGSAVDAAIDEILADANNHNSKQMRDRLEAVVASLDPNEGVEQYLYGGSVSKHTAVDGISDVDALVIVSDENAAERKPADLVQSFAQQLRRTLDQREFVSISPGSMAVTITCNDGMELQLLPAMRKGDRVWVSGNGGDTWQMTEPRAFREALTAANRATNGALVRAIKLYKVINSTLPEQKRLSGYHIEAMAVDSVKDYDGPRTPRRVLERFLQHSLERVLTPMRDVTGQSGFVDAALGEAGSIDRRLCASGIDSVRRRLAGATAVEEWKAIFGE